jgi:hypothetical protein
MTIRPLHDTLYSANYSNSRRVIIEMLGKISYKPGWKIRLIESPNTTGFYVVATYEGYESENAAFEPVIMEEPQVRISRERMALSIGKTVRKNQQYKYTKYFDEFTIERMRPEDIIRHIIYGTIREAEQWEMDRWFKYEGVPVFDTARERST